MLAQNLLNAGDTAAFADTGTWANKAIKEAKAYGNIKVVNSSKDKNYSYIPKDFSGVPADARFLHVTSNNTIFGTQMQTWPEVAMPLVCDMSSDIFSRPIPIEKFGLIYAGAQKNLGPAGVTMVILRKIWSGLTLLIICRRCWITRPLSLKTHSTIHHRCFLFTFRC